MSIILRLTVQDRHGVLDRITGLIRRNGWNINEINAGEKRGGLSNINIRLKDRGADLKVLGKSLTMLDCVEEWEECREERHMIRELLTLKLREADCAGLLEGMRAIAKEDGVVFLEYTGLPWEIDGLLERLNGKLLDCARTGALSLTKGGEGDE